MQSLFLHEIRLLKLELVSQIIFSSRLYTLLQEISQEKENRTIIFAMTKRKVDLLSRIISRAGWRAGAIHGDKSQVDRDAVLRSKYYLP